MQHLARKFEAEITFDFGSVIGTMENPRPTPLSLMREMTADGHSVAAAYIDFQSRLLKSSWIPSFPAPHPGSLRPLHAYAR